MAYRVIVSENLADFKTEFITAIDEIIEGTGYKRTADYTFEHEKTGVVSTVTFNANTIDVVSTNKQEKITARNRNSLGYKKAWVFFTTEGLFCVMSDDVSVTHFGFGVMEKHVDWWEHEPFWVQGYYEASLFGSKYYNYNACSICFNNTVFLDAQMFGYLNNIIVNKTTLASSVTIDNSYLFNDCPFMLIFQNRGFGLIGKTPFVKSCSRNLKNFKIYNSIKNKQYIVFPLNSNFKYAVEL